MNQEQYDQMMDDLEELMERAAKSREEANAAFALRSSIPYEHVCAEIERRLDALIPSNATPEEEADIIRTNLRRIKREVYEESYDIKENP